MKSSAVRKKMRSPTLRQYMKESVEKRRRAKSNSKSNHKKENFNKLFKDKIHELISVIKSRVREKSLKEFLASKVQDL